MSFRSTLVENISLFAVSAILVAVTIIYIANWSAALARPYTIGYEGPMIWACAYLSHGQNIYPLSGLSHEPWIVTIYPPLYFVIGAFLLKIFGVSYAPLRVMSMCAAGITGYSMFRLLRLYGCSVTVIVSALFFFMSTSVVAVQSYSARPDMLMIALSVLMLERFVCVTTKQAASKPNLKEYIPVLFLAVLALFVKQQAVVFVLSALIYLALFTSTTFTVIFVAVLLFCFAAVTALVQLVTGGGYIPHLLFLLTVKSQLPILFTNISALGVDLVKIVIALLFATIGILKVDKRDALNKLPLLLLFVSVFTMSISMGIPASSEHHAIASIFALTWWLALTMQRLPKYCSTLMAIICIITFPVMVQGAQVGPLLMPFAKASAQQLNDAGLKDKVVLTDDPNINLLTQSKPVFIDCATFMNVWQAKNDDMSELLTGIRSHRYKSVIINEADVCSPGQAWWPGKVISAVKNDYKKVDKPLACSGWLMDWFQPTGEAQ